MTRHPKRMVNSKNCVVWPPWPVKDMRSLMYFNITCLSIAGLFPFKYNSQTYLFSKARFAVSTIFTFAYIAFMGQTAYKINSMNIFRSRLWYAHSYFYLFAAAVSIFTTYSTTHRRLNVLQKTLKLMRILSRQDFNDLGKFVYTNDLIVILYFTMVLLFHATEWTTFSLQQCGSLYIGFVLVAGHMFNVNCVRVLGACFKKVNERLKQLNTPLMHHRPEFIRPNSLLCGRNTLLLMHVKHCEELYQEISDTVEVLNDTFRERIIIFITSIFITTTFHLYFTLQWMSKNDIPGLSNLAARFMSFLMIIYTAIKLFLLIYVCETASNEASEITTTVHAVATDCSDSDVRRELMYFARQVQHQDVQFSASAFTVNAKLLSELLGAILMYTIILIQFILDNTCPDEQSP